MERFEGLFKALLDFLFLLFKNLGIFGKGSKMPDVLNQYVEDAQTVIDAARG